MSCLPIKECDINGKCPSGGAGVSGVGGGERLLLYSISSGPDAQCVLHQVHIFCLGNLEECRVAAMHRCIDGHRTLAFLCECYAINFKVGYVTWIIHIMGCLRGAVSLKVE